MFAHMPDIAELLSRVPLLRDLSEADLGRLAGQTRRLDFEPDHDIVEIGRPGRSLFLILEGTVRVLYPSSDIDFELARLGPGDFFGEMALLNDKPRSATVRSVEPVRALALDKEQFREVVLDRPDLGLQFLQVMSVRMRNADEQISSLSDQALKDPLTELPNRRAFRERIREEIDRVRRYGVSFSLVLLDLDDFKAINDGLGFDAGDEILAWVGRILMEHTRGSDMPFRIGGEEFAVVCPSTGADTARFAALRLVGVIGEAQTPLAHPIHVTVSAGYCSCPDHGSTYEALYRLAHRAMKRAKRNGRGQVAPAELRDVGPDVLA